MNGMVVLLVMLANRLVVMPRAIAELLVVAAAMLCLMTPLPTAVAVAVECTLAPFASFATLTLATLAAFATVGTFACPVSWLAAVVTSSLLLSLPPVVGGAIGPVAATLVLVLLSAVCFISLLATTVLNIV